MEFDSSNPKSFPTVEFVLSWNNCRWSGSLIEVKVVIVAVIYGRCILDFLQCCDTVSWLTGRTFSP